MSKRSIEDIERELYMAQFRVKRCQYNDHLFDMEKWEYEVDILKEELEKVKSENELRQSISDTLDDYTWSLSSALTNHKLDKDDGKLTENQEKIREKIVDIIIGKTKRFYNK